jgi:hypothetical protein
VLPLLRLLRLGSAPVSKGFKIDLLSPHQWLMPVILSTEEEEIRKMAGSSPKQTVFETLSQKKSHHKKGLVEWLKW